MSPAVKALRMTSVLEESDTSSDTDQEIFYPFHSTAERVYATAAIGLSAQEIYMRIMGCCTNQENVCDLNMSCQMSYPKNSIGNESWEFTEVL